MGAARVTHALLILLLLAVPAAFIASQPAECTLSTHSAGSGSIDRPHDGSHCRLSETRAKDPAPMPTAVPTGSPSASSPVFQAAVDVPEKEPRVIVAREPGSPVSIFIQTRTILL